MGVAILGFVGGCLLWRWALVVVSVFVGVGVATILCSFPPTQYSIIVAVFVALEIAGAITGFVFRSQVVGVIIDSFHGNHGISCVAGGHTYRCCN